MRRLSLLLCSLALAAGSGLAASPRLVIDDDEYVGKVIAACARLVQEHKLVPLDTLRRQVHAQAYPFKAVPPAKARLEPPALYDRLLESTLAVGTYYKCPDCGQWHFNSSVGFMVGDGLLCTCCHVVSTEDEGVTEAYLVAADAAARVFPVRAVVAADTEADTCLLRAEGCPLKPLPLRAEVRPGERVYCLSHPAGYYFMFSQGMVARLNRRPNEVLDSQGRTNGLLTRPILFLNVTAEFAPGSSGAPVVDDAGNVVAQVASIADAGEPPPGETNSPPSPSVPVRFCTAAEEILKLKSEIRNPKPEVREPMATPPDGREKAQKAQTNALLSPRCLWPNLLAGREKVFFSAFIASLRSSSSPERACCVPEQSRQPCVLPLRSSILRLASGAALERCVRLRYAVARQVGGPSSILHPPSSPGNKLGRSFAALTPPRSPPRRLCQAAPSPAGHAPQKLPKIRLARDGRTFATETGTPFVPLGVTYYRPGTGWAPQVWKQFDAEATGRDFARLRALGLNCVRVFLSFHSFYTDPGVLRPEGLDKFDQFLALAEAAGLYVHPTGPDHWEGPPNWQPVAVEDERTLQALESFWRLFAARYCGRNVIFAYDLKNEPEVAWDSEALRTRWNAWLERRYGSAQKVAAAWGATNQLALGALPPPKDTDALNSPALLDYQHFREDVADEWTRRQVAAIKAADPDALATAGAIQWAVPCLLPAGVRHYAAFRPERQARFLDFLEIHFYPLENGAYDYKNEADELANLAYLEAVARECARPGKPVVLAEFGWYGGGKPKFAGGTMAEATEDQHARYCRRVVDTSAGLVTGWLNWGFYDHPGAGDCSELTGLLTADGKLKAWGRTFQELAARFSGKPMPTARLGRRPTLDWEACITSTQAARAFRQDYLRAFLAERAPGP